MLGIIDDFAGLYGRPGDLQVRNSISTLAAGMLLAGVVTTTAYGAEDCKSIDPEQAIADLVLDKEGGKVLKVEESENAHGCIELKVRILIDGTIQAITIPNETGA